MSLRSPRLARAVLFAAALAVASTARAVQYETEIDVDVEADLYDLLTRGEISSDTLNTLVELLNEGVDLNTATREEIYELPGLTYDEVDAIVRYREQTRIADPADLVAAGALTQEQLLHVAAFLVLGDEKVLPVGGHLRAMTAYALPDDTTAGAPQAYPPAFLRARGKFPLNLSAGVALDTTRQRMSNLRYSLEQGGLIADLPSYQFHVPKFYAQWKSAMFQVLVGTFRIGFGQRLTLDNTTRNQPDGFYADDVIDTPNEDLARACRLSGGSIDGTSCGVEAEGVFVTPDFKWRDSFRGLAASVKKIPLGTAADLSMHAFGSYLDRSIYQYEIFDTTACLDPTSDSSACSAPQVRVAGDAAGRRFSYSTLPGAYDEVAAGGNVNLGFGSGNHVGISGYWANDYWKVDGIALDFQEWSNRPWGGAFGAIGLDASARAGRFTISGEGTRSFDSMPRADGSTGLGGGYGAFLKLLANVQKTHEIEASLRYYDKGFVNPLARPLANSDEYLGQRARNEVGGQLRYKGRPNVDWILRALVDVSIWPENGTAASTAGLTNLEVFGRADFVGWRDVKLGAFAEYKNKDIAVGGRGLCYTGASTEEDPFGNAMPCAGEFYRFGARGQYTIFGRKLQVAAQYQHELLDDTKYKAGFRQDILAWFELTSAPLDPLLLRWRTRYLNESLDDNTYGEQSILSWVDVGYLPTRNLEVHLRYAPFGWLDQRTYTLGRKSLLQHRFRLEVEARF